MSEKHYTDEQYETFLNAYLQTLLWTDTNDCDEPLEDDYGIEDINARALHEINSDCMDFLELVYADMGVLFDASPNAFRDSQGNTWSQLEQSAHDYALTRNGHGAGYWDRSEDTYGEEVDLKALSELATAMGSMGLYVGDDGELYHHG